MDSFVQILTAMMMIALKSESFGRIRIEPVLVGLMTPQIKKKLKKDFMERWLNTQVFLQRTLVWFPAPMLNGSLLPITFSFMRI